MEQKDNEVKKKFMVLTLLRDVTIEKMDYKEVMAVHNELYHHGYDVCKGCEYDRYASCHEGRVEHCRRQIKKTLDHPDEMKRPCWWEKNK